MPVNMPDWNDVRATVDANLLKWRAEPAIPSWSRLEPLTLTSGDLLPGAQAHVADPLWMLGRQWQFDELHGEDAGSPVRATVEAESAPLSQFRSGTERDSPGTVTVRLPAQGEPSMPLEVCAEAEVPPVLALRLRTQWGLHLTRLLRGAGLHEAADAFIEEFPPPATPDGAPEDPAGDARLRLAAGRVPDGAAVLSALDSFDDGSGGLSGLPPAVNATAAALPLVADWRNWAISMFAAGTGSSWNPHRLEYSFGVQADFSDGPVVLAMDEYTGGALDWFHGDLREGNLSDSVPGQPDLPGAPPAPVQIRDTTLPAPVQFAGMPSNRLFGFEDSAVYLGGVQAGRTDLVRLAVAEFALAFSVDWFQVPLKLAYGTVTRVDRLSVYDTFAVQVEVDPAAESTNPGWAAFRSTPLTDNSRLSRMFVLQPTAPKVLEGQPLEEVALFRDEMANIVWAVERIVPGWGSGEPVSRSRQAARVSLPQPEPEDLGDARIVYRLMTPVPENWIPLVPVRSEPQNPTSNHVLERRPMLQFPPDGSVRLVHPMGTVLLSDPAVNRATDRLQIAEAEVPREGAVVTKTFQLARTAGGGTVLWMGRRVRIGQGEGSSGLRFDTALPPGGI
ncbi:hypothetical protein [Arthrobacter sp. OAP107]|uniref:hypothetical protein n=1 Tax=Arthrobacter sp. OAP107 TaxID=3156445 RepID=UPI003390910F